MVRLAVGLAVIVAASWTSWAAASDWSQFRGPRASGQTDEQLPVVWSPTKNLQWSTALPGAGSSSPIVWQDKVFVTCYSGTDDRSLQRHLVCLSLKDGTILWSKSEANPVKEDRYEGFLREHGYASNTPVTDGERVYVFFGKGGVLAYSMTGERLWQTFVGEESGDKHWGSGASLVLNGKVLIVNATEESQSIRGLDTETGKELWKAEASSLELAYNTPNLYDRPGGRRELLVAVPGELWGLDPEKGKLKWHVDTQLEGNVSPSVLIDRDTAYVFGGIRSAGSHAIKLNGEGGKPTKGWSSRNSSYVATPVLHDQHLYWIDDRGLAFCIRASNGELVYRERVEGLAGASGRPVYASPIVAAGKIYVPSRWKGTYVLKAAPKYELLHVNELGDESDFNASPAVADRQLLLRSNKRLYCIGEK